MLHEPKGARSVFRPIYTRLLDHVGFRRLAPETRLLLLVIKIMLPAEGIDEVYPEALADKTGLDSARVAAALDELTSAAWIRREGRLIWLVNGLRYETNDHANHELHRRGLQRRIAALPDLDIVAAFKAYYPEWFVSPDDGQVPATSSVTHNTEGHPQAARKGSSNGIPKGLPNGYHKGISNTTLSGSGSGSGGSGGSRARPAEPAGFGEVWAEYPRREGGNSRKDAARAYAARLREGVSPEVLLAGVQRYRAFCQAKGIEGTSYVKHAVTFFGPGEHYVEPWAVASQPAVSSSGERVLGRDEMLAQMATEDADTRQRQAARDAERAAAHAGAVS